MQRDFCFEYKKFKWKSMMMGIQPDRIAQLSSQHLNFFKLLPPSLRLSQLYVVRLLMTNLPATVSSKLSAVHVYMGDLSLTHYLQLQPDYPTIQ